MGSLEEKDDTLVDILHELKRKYYRQVLILSIITVLAIITNLLMVYLKAGSWFGKPIKTVARDLIKKDAGAPSSDPRIPAVNESAFTHQFIELEKAIRKALQKRTHHQTRTRTNAQSKQIQKSYLSRS
jgi:hypothetical protein